MPHISQLQQDHQDTVTFIGVTPEDEETVHTFMAELQDEETGKTWNEVIQYNIALDRDSATNDAYMRAAEQTGIPTAFIIGKDGLIEWMGHPMSIDQPIADVLSDQWDREAALAKLEADRAMEVAQREVSVAARRAKESGDWTEVLQMVEKLVLKNPESSEMKIVQFNVLLVAEEYEDLNRLADELSAQVWDDANYLNRIAWQMVTRVPKDKQDLVVALKIALRASELADRNASVLETVARVYHEMGERDAAIQWQQRAVDAAPDQKVLRDALEKYEAENKEPL
jgi:tetratricopeptide (TPR) repeat protein